jgi:hypothetical protein
MLLRTVLALRITTPSVEAGEPMLSIPTALINTPTAPILLRTAVETPLCRLIAVHLAWFSIQPMFARKRTTLTYLDMD